MQIITPNKFIDYMKKFDDYNDKNLTELMENAILRTDVLPAIEHETAHLISLLIKISNSKKVLELGTCLGISTLVIALALPNDGKVTTIEHMKNVAKEADENFVTFGVSHKVRQIIGDVYQQVPSLNEKFDIVFQDSGKQTYLPLLDNIVSLLVPGGLLLADDTLMPAMDLPDRNAKTQDALDKFNKAVFQHSELESFILPLGHGLTIARKIA